MNWHEDFGYLGDTERRNLKALVPGGHVPRYADISWDGPILDVIGRLQSAIEEGGIAIASNLGGWQSSSHRRLIGSRPMTTDEQAAAKQRSEKASAAAAVRKLKAREKKWAQLEKLRAELGDER